MLCPFNTQVEQAETNLALAQPGTYSRPDCPRGSVIIATIQGAVR
jgi:hypothetical protein